VQLGDTAALNYPVRASVRRYLVVGVESDSEFIGINGHTVDKGCISVFWERKFGW
jgi:hypothetical protein